MRKLLITAIGGCLIGLISASAADVVIKLRPPVAVRERRTERPTPRHVWINGYHRWDGNAYVWEHGRWELPPREHAVWVAPRYVHRDGGYVFVEGHWR